MTGEGGSRYFTNYIKYLQELSEKAEKGVILKIYLFDFRRIS